MNSKNEPEYWIYSERLTHQFLMVPLTDVKVLEKYEAEVAEWVAKECK